MRGNITTETLKVFRTGSVHVKARARDPVYQDFAVRHTENRIEYFHKQLSDWCELPAEWKSLVTWDLPKTVELMATDPHKLSHQRSWFVLPSDSDQPLYNPDTSGEDPSLKACETWLRNRGYRVRGETPPECFLYDLVD